MTKINVSPEIRAYRPLKSPVSYNETIRIGKEFHKLFDNFLPKKGNRNKQKISLLNDFSVKNKVTLKEIPHIVDVYDFLKKEKKSVDDVKFNAVIETKTITENDKLIWKMRNEDMSAVVPITKTPDVEVNVPEPVVEEKTDDDFGIGELVDMINKANEARKEAKIVSKTVQKEDVFDKLSDEQIHSLFACLGVELPEEKLANARNKRNKYKKFVNAFGLSFTVDSEEKFDKLNEFFKTVKD